MSRRTGKTRQNSCGIERDFVATRRSCIILCPNPGGVERDNPGGNPKCGFSCLHGCCCWVHQHSLQSRPSALIWVRCRLFSLRYLHRSGSRKRCEVGSMDRPKLDSKCVSIYRGETIALLLGLESLPRADGEHDGAAKGI
jgi:hypothetical protein